MAARLTIRCFKKKVNSGYTVLQSEHAGCLQKVQRKDWHIKKTRQIYLAPQRAWRIVDNTKSVTHVSATKPLLEGKQ